VVCSTRISRPRAPGNAASHLHHERPLAPPALSDRYTVHMAKQVTATDAKATILRLLDDAAAGEEIEITRHGRPVARLVPASGARSLKGSFDGVAVTAVEEEQLFSTGEAWNAS
jgi:prevent-host-death family protein